MLRADFLPSLRRIRENNRIEDAGYGDFDSIVHRVAQHIRDVGYLPSRIDRFFDRVAGITVEQCDKDGGFWPSDNMHNTHDGGRISDGAARRYYIKCCFCNRLVRPSDTSTYRFSRYEENQKICPTCTNDEEVVWIDAFDVYTHCDSASSFNNDDEDEDEDEDERSEYPSGVSRLVQSYSARADDRLESFRHEPWEHLPFTPLWLGVELEAEPGRGELEKPDYIRLTHETVGDFAILKTDATLGSGGIEIVSVPATLAAHRRLWEPFFEKAAPRLRGWHTNRCGMHVHIDRSAIGVLAVGKMLTFVNDPDNRAFIEHIAGRGAGSYNCYSRGYDGHKVRVRQALRMTASHYNALSWSTTNNGKTMELRIFRSNLKKDGFFKNLEFTHALVVFCQQASITGLGSADFLRWVRLPAQCRDYPVLTRWLRRTGELPPLTGNLRTPVSIETA